MTRALEFLKKALYWVSLLKWILEKLINAIETFPQNTSGGGPGGRPPVSDEEKK